MEPHRFEQDGETYEARFERADTGWLAHIRRTGDGRVQTVAFPDGAGYAEDDLRGSLIAGCEAAVARLAAPAPTRH
ncbi:hypothetical protein [Methylobacterium oxalidis]|uniref:Uncharacterized protein n=1 Tax=Methylobacterium oxalidis TaxID=944322 RepID=A0A512IYE0_9HYPH|nr:hypothetical protein [Methylobacterium oxalidis]GEP02720.1 hypothetical protein MOX02_07580 [Methylobacterium oxalidis]GJE33574.1 hypothetical protein LDDCCGHA_3775 [Methylobacterium oxalidis]GLS66882.1 hypothetical protein GCM10007888_52650 [Methylobacterium oxalidis]